MKSSKYKNQKVLVLGLGKSGYYAAKLLHSLGAEVTLNDAQDLTDDPKAKELEELNISVISGGHPDHLLDETFAYLVKNPGIPYENKMVQEALSLKIPVITEVEVATSMMDGYLIGVTGTNGKTTTTSIIQQMLNLKRAKGFAYAIGNIGVPASEVALTAKKEDDLVMELSSFQLMGTPTLQPKIAVITNLYSAHLDYHGTQAAYEAAKMNLIKNQNANNYLIYNKDQAHLEELVLENTKATLLPFSRKQFLEKGISVKEQSIYFNGEKVAAVSDVFLAGLHNLENMLAAIGVAKLKNVPNQIIQEVLKNFRGVKHRTQFVTTFNERIFYNDSKATNMEATENALAGFSQPVILLAGGLNRGNTFEPLIPALQKHVKAVVSFGETADLILEVAKKAGVKELIKAENVEQAVPKAYDLSEAGDVILLSPAAASWDQYPNFEIRGDKFIDAVAYLEKNEKDQE